MSRRAYPCTKCNELFFLYRELEKHMKNTHKLVKIWKCKKCLQTFQGVDEFDKHIEYDHKDVPLYSMGLAMSQVKRDFKELFDSEELR